MVSHGSPTPARTPRWRPARARTSRRPAEPRSLRSRRSRGSAATTTWGPRAIESIEAPWYTVNRLCLLHGGVVVVADYHLQIHARTCGADYFHGALPILPSCGRSTPSVDPKGPGWRTGRKLLNEPRHTARPDRLQADLQPARRPSETGPRSEPGQARARSVRRVQRVLPNRDGGQGVGVSADPTPGARNQGVVNVGSGPGGPWRFHVFKSDKAVNDR